MPAANEDQLNVECYTWFHNTYPQYRDLLWHTPNGGSRDYREANKFKAMGVRPGIPDYMMLFRGQLWELEGKFEKGTQSPAQKHIEILHTEHGAKYVIYRTLAEFQQIINIIIT